VDISGLLLGRTQVNHVWPSEQHNMPAALKESFHQLSVTVTIRKQMPDDVKVATSELELMPFLPPGLREQLSPVVLHFHRAISVPDMPATPAQLDTECYRCCCQLFTHDVLLLRQKHNLSASVPPWTGLCNKLLCMCALEACLSSRHDSNMTH
jgi:hypothetical protein